MVDRLAAVIGAVLLLGVDFFAVAGDP